MITSSDIPQKRKLSHFRDLLRVLVIRDMKLRYKHSYFGFAWSLLNPILHVSVLYLIFGLVWGSSIQNYISYLFSGLLVYGWFQSSLLQASTIVTSNPELVRKPGFPTTILPIIPLVSNLLHLLLALPILLIFLTIEGGRLSGTVVLLPIILGVQFCFTLGIAFMVASLNVLFRDTRYLLEVFLRLFFFLSPIFYQVEQVAIEYQPYFYLNPLVGLLGAYRDILINAITPEWPLLYWPTLLSIGTLCLGYWAYGRTKDKFIEEI